MSDGRCTCPSCGRQFGWLERWRFHKFLGLARRAAPCPDCGAMLVYAKWPHRGMTAAACFGILLFLIRVAGGVRPPALLMLIAAGLMLLAALELELVRVEAP